MIIKILTLGIVIYIVYTIFFKNKNNKQDDQIDTMVECNQCGTFVAQDEAIIHNGKYFCSKQCIKQG